MKPMRRSDRKITDPAEILAILREAKVCHLSMVDDEGAYVVPLNFGHALTTAHETDGLPQGLTLYFHSASSGRKISAMRNNPRVCFVVDGAHALIESDALTDYTYHYQSVIGSGTVAFVTDDTARMDAMVALMLQQSDLTEAQIRAMPRDERWMKNDVMAVLALTVTELQAKRHD